MGAFTRIRYNQNGSTQSSHHSTTPIIHFEHPPPGTLLRFLLITTKPTASSFATFYPPNTFISAAQEPRIILPGEGTAMVSTGNGIFHLVSVDDNGQTTDHSEQTPTPSIIPLSSDLSHIDSNLFKHITTNLSHSHLSMCVTPPKHSSPTHVVIFNLLTTSRSRVSVKTVGGPRYVLYCRALERGAIVNERIEPVDVLLGDNGRVTGHVLEMIRLKDIGGGNSIGSLDPSLTERAVKDRTADSDIAQAIKVVESARSSSEGEGGTLFSETERSTLPSDGVETPCCTTVESTSDMDSTATGLPPRPKSRLPPPRVSWSTPSDGSPGIPHYVDIDTDNPSTSTKDREEQTIGTLWRYGIPVQRGWCWWVGGWIVFWLKVGVVWLARSLGKRETEHGDNGGRERTPLMKNVSEQVWIGHRNVAELALIPRLLGQVRSLSELRKVDRKSRSQMHRESLPRSPRQPKISSSPSLTLHRSISWWLRRPAILFLKPGEWTVPTG